MVKARNKGQNPKAVDTLIGWVVLAGAAMFLFPILARNTTPYVETVILLTSGVGGLFWWILRIPGLRWLIGVLSFTAIQLLEIWPLLSEESPEERNHAVWGRVMGTRWMLAMIAYTVDAIQCAIYWPVLLPGIEPMDLVYSFDFGLINWGNLAQTALTLFGAAAYVCLYKYTRRVA